MSRDPPGMFSLVAALMIGRDWKGTRKVLGSLNVCMLGRFEDVQPGS